MNIIFLIFLTVVSSLTLEEFRNKRNEIIRRSITRRHILKDRTRYFFVPPTGRQHFETRSPGNAKGVAEFKGLRFLQMVFPAIFTTYFPEGYERNRRFFFPNIIEGSQGAGSAYNTITRYILDEIEQFHTDPFRTLIGHDPSRNIELLGEALDGFRQAMNLRIAENRQDQQHRIHLDHISNVWEILTTVIAILTNAR